MNNLEQLPSSLRHAAIHNQPEGCENVAWRRLQAIDVIHYLQSSNTAVLGGDVIVKKDGVFELTLDSWHSDHQKGETWSAYAARSRQEAMDYLTRYPEEGDVAYTFVLQEKPAAGDLLLEREIRDGA